MANLFFIHTPFQLITAQQLILQENLKNNLMIYGYSANHKDHLDIYDLTIIQELWNDHFYMWHLDEWSNVTCSKYIFKDIINVLKRYQKIIKIIKEKDIDNIYLGDINNIHYKFSTILFHKKGIDISFFEEGASHYIQNKHKFPKRKLMTNICSIIADYLCYKPFFKIKWSKYLYREDFPISILPIKNRYSFIPLFHESIDKRLYYTHKESIKLNSYIEKELAHIETESGILVLTSPIYELLYHIPEKISKQLYRDTLFQYFQDNKNCRFFIKFHPREQFDDRNIILKQLSDNNINFKVLGVSLNLPAEYYLHHTNFKKIATFSNSTSLYNGYLYPYTTHDDLLINFRNNCLQNNVTALDKIDNLISFYNNFKNGIK